MRSHRIYGNPLKEMAAICRNALLYNVPYNLHIFFNSVECAKTIVDTLSLTTATTRIVCADRSENRAKLNGFPISSTSQPIRKINFYTSTAFEGCDIYDPDGVTFIVSTPQKKHTMLDISTSFIQVCGRIRDTRYKEVIHLYSTLPYMDVSLEEFEQTINKAIEEAEGYVSWVNSAPEKMREKAIKSISYMNEKYIIEDNGQLKVDRNMANYEIVN